MSRHIHSSAVVDPKAQLAEDVVVGPGAVIGPDVTIGAGSEIRAHAVVTGKVIMGERNQVGYGAIIGSEPQDLSWKRDTPCGVRIGSDNVFREYVTIHLATRPEGWTEVGDHNYLMTGSHMGHDSRIANRVIMANNALLGGHVEVQEGVVIGGGAVFHQYIRVGRYAMIQGNAGFGKDVPPFLVGLHVNEVAGINAIGLRRAGFSSEERQEVRRAYKLLYREGLNTSQALETAAGMPWGPAAASFFQFIREAKKRGFCSAVTSPGADEE